MTQAQPLSRTDETLDCFHHAIIGYTGSGKTSFIKRHPFYTERPRVLAWDPEESYKGLRTYTTIKGFLAAVREAGYNDIRARLVMEPTTENFEAFCEIVWRVAHQAKPMLVIAEELSDVCSPGKASRFWGQILRKGRKYAIAAFSVSQRPQEIDKTCFSQSVFKWCGVLGSMADYKYMANVINVPVEELQKLQELQFYIRKGAKCPKPGEIVFNH
ncbi:hypothetical protein [Agarivorans sp. QJM3NY_25]|uniref:hypothetical protein n=1 Tax=Agarivorans sp. QJM3NY_25 TaxID=3421430 RepID=UPI003D7DD78C